jgi:hypothetical protein
VITVTYLSPAAGVSPDVLIDPDHGDPVEPAGVVDEHALALDKTASLAVVHDGGTAPPAAQPPGWVSAGRRLAIARSIRS